MEVVSPIADQGGKRRCACFPTHDHDVALGVDAGTGAPDATDDFDMEDNPSNFKRRKRYVSACGDSSSFLPGMESSFAMSPFILTHSNQSTCGKKQLRFCRKECDFGNPVFM